MTQAPVTPVAASDATTSSRPSIGQYLALLGIQVVYITPIFWFMELFQNWLYLLATGKWGWFYPESPYHWFYFPSLFLWAGSVAIMWGLTYFVFAPRKVARWKRVLIAGTVCWAAEWFAGWASITFTGHWMQVWNDAPLVFIKGSAWFFWCFDFVFHHFLTTELVDLTPSYEDH